MGDAEHWAKIRYLEHHLPFGVPIEPPIERCRRCNCTANAHPNQGWRTPGEDGYAPDCAEMTEPYWDGTPWPATFGDMIDGQPVHRVDQGRGYCFQCLHCAHYDAIDADWGWCGNPASQYHREAFRHQVFEHWTCKAYTPEEE